MIRLIRRRLIIPRGDSGSFSIPTIGTVREGDIAIFGIFDPLTHKTLVMKKIVATEQKLTISLISEDTINLEPRKYNWDITIYKNPQYDEDGELVGATEVNSYYSAYKLPVCEITEVALDMNKERWKTAELTLDTNDYQSANSIQTVYPWEKIQQFQLEEQLYNIAVCNGYVGTQKDFLHQYNDIFSNGSVYNGLMEDFPIPGNEKNIYIDINSNSIYYFRKTTETLHEDVLEKLGAIVVGTNINEETKETETYLYIPLRALPLENLIYNSGDTSDVND